MGTRHLTCVFLGNEFRVAQYGQWDGYPTGQGKTVYEFLKNCDLANFRDKVSKLTTLTDEEVSNRWKAHGAGDSPYVSMNISKSVGVAHPELSRDTGAEILRLIAEGSVSDVHLQVEFAADSLFCEWAYVVDLDKNVLEVYEGFQKEPNTGRFAYLFEEVERREDDQYYPVALRASFALDDLPDYEVYLEMLTDRDE